ncbi:nitrous oxide-stimulated promoter family protein [Paenibacillus phoenicis]|uniref:Nitrous oxide-stimulated promoter family protein n=1 Tax=Paenibacillus phoenicis TaxID=554117 RepID=A0ABU5PNM1_9BACL|nr:nitrous oxide-stimulated promoter family protein [Paenibacillus phoenicis]MEA3571495.1 nitrous oxide-stimulated promoter family protein [Paenibacillus phoenicis]
MAMTKNNGPRIRRVMAFAGPRMLWRHPVLTLMHLLDGVKKGHSQ